MCLQSQARFVPFWDMADLLRIRLEPDVKKLVESGAKKSGRSLPKEANMKLRESYSTVEIRLDMIPPTYWSDAMRAQYLKTGVYPGTEDSENPVIHTRKQRGLTEPRKARR